MAWFHKQGHPTPVSGLQMVDKASSVITVAGEHLANRGKSCFTVLPLSLNSISFFEEGRLSGWFYTSISPCQELCYLLAIVNATNSESLLFFKWVLVSFFIMPFFFASYHLVHYTVVYLVVFYLWHIACLVWINLLQHNLNDRSS